MHRFAEFVVEHDEIVGTGGFLALRRLRLRNRRADGTVSPPYTCDYMVRPYGQDAVVVVVYARNATGGVDVLLRDGLRPPLFFGRRPDLAPLPEPAASPWSRELVAGILEVGDHGEAGLRARACAEVAEEAGFDVAPDAVQLLGAGTYPSPGGKIEKFYFTAVPVTPAAQRALDGDGSPMEEGATTSWMSLDDAIAACVRGDLCDAKTEIGLRRFRDTL
jgi:ADP-ribose pyrophosphatase